MSKKPLYIYKHSKCDKAIIDNRPEDTCDACKSAIYSLTAKVNAILNRRDTKK